MNPAGFDARSRGRVVVLRQLSFTLAFLILSVGGKNSEELVCGRDEVCMLQSLFTENEGGWTVAGSGAARPRSVSFLKSERSIEATDKGSETWYWSGQDGGFSGNLSWAYNGELRFKLWHPSQPPAGTDGAKLVKGHPDIILESACGFQLTLSSVLASNAKPARYSVVLSEVSDAWIDSRTKRKATPLALMEALSNLITLKIRGSLFAGAETARLAEVRLAPSGERLVPCCTPDGTVDACSSMEAKRKYSRTLTPQGFNQFMCGVSAYENIAINSQRRPKVLAIYPRHSRASGGNRVTVFGENFGLDGTKGVLRVAGKPAAGCKFVRVQHCLNGFLDYDEEGPDCGGKDCAPCVVTRPHCSNGVLDADEDKKDCGGMDCRLCSPVVLPAHCSNGVLDVTRGEIVIDAGGPYCLPTFCFNALLYGDKTNPAGNCGGSCQPCVPWSNTSATPAMNDENFMVVCDVPAHTETEEQGVDWTFVKEERETGFNTWGCLDDSPAGRGFLFGGADFIWSQHWAALDQVHANHVSVSRISVDQQTGDVYVLATANKTVAANKSNGTMGVFATHYGPGGYPNEPGVRRDTPIPDPLNRYQNQFVIHNQGDTRVLGSLQYIYTVLARISANGELRWLTMLDSFGSFVGTDLIIDNSIGPTTVYVAGGFRGGNAHIYVPDPVTRLPRRGPRFGEGLVCDPEVVGNTSNITQVWVNLRRHYPQLDGTTSTSFNATEVRALANISAFRNEDCWYTVGDGNRFDSPISTLYHDQGSYVQPNKWGLFIAAMDTNAVPLTIKTGFYFKGSGSFIDIPSVRMAAHTTESDARADRKGSGFATGYGGLYLAARLVISKFGDIVYLGEQAPGYGGVGSCVNGEVVANTSAGAANNSYICVKGVSRDKDVMNIVFEQEIPTPDLNPTYLVVIKLVVNANRRSIGSLWARLIGDIGAGDSGNLAGLKADVGGVYIAGTFTRGVRSFGFQNCTLGVYPSECLRGGHNHIPEVTRAVGQSACSFQRNVKIAPNQVCSDSYEGMPVRYNVEILSKSMVTGSKNETGRLQLFRSHTLVAAFSGDGTLRWTRFGFGGNNTARALAVVDTPAVQNANMERSSGRYVYVTGAVSHVLTNNKVDYSDFGKMKEPVICSTTTQGNVGDYGLVNKVTACSGTLTAMGTGLDIFLLKLEADSGTPVWLKRIGSIDAVEDVRDIVADSDQQAVYIVGAYSHPTSSLPRDVFGLAAAGRRHALGCPSGANKPQWLPAKASWDWTGVDASLVGLPDCIFATQSKGGMTAVLVKVMDGAGQSGKHGDVSKPYSQCLLAGEKACNSDGIVWALPLSGTLGYTSKDSTVRPTSVGEAVAVFKGSVYVGARFTGITKRITGVSFGLTTPGVDDRGFFNLADINTEDSIVSRLQE